MAAASAAVERQWRSAKLRSDGPDSPGGCDPDDSALRKRPITAHPPHPSGGAEAGDEEEEEEEAVEEEAPEEEEEEIAEEIDLIRDIDIGSSDSLNFFG